MITAIMNISHAGNFQATKGVARRTQQDIAGLDVGGAVGWAAPSSMRKPRPGAEDDRDLFRTALFWVETHKWLQSRTGIENVATLPRISGVWTVLFRADTHRVFFDVALEPFWRCGFGAIAENWSVSTVATQSAPLTMSQGPMMQYAPQQTYGYGANTVQYARSAAPYGSSAGPMMMQQPSVCLHPTALFAA